MQAIDTPLNAIQAKEHETSIERKDTIKEDPTNKTENEDKKKNETKLDVAIKICYFTGGVFYCCNQIKQLFWSEKKQPIDIPDQLYTAREKIRELIAKNAEGTIGRYGLPTACDIEIKKLVFIPGGPDLLEELRQLFESYVAETKANGNKLHIK